MPRVGRKAAGGVIYHVLNRGNGGQRLFDKPADYDAFVALLAQTRRAVPGVRLLAYCLMPNHWHLVLWPRRDGELSSFMLRLCTAHVRRRHAYLMHRARRSRASGKGQSGAASVEKKPAAPRAAGHLYQGRFKSFPVDDDERYLLALLRYVESNPLRARPPLAKEPRGWRWTSFAARGTERAKEMGLLDEWPVDVPRDWESLLAEALPEAQLGQVRTAVARGRPFGRDRWVESTAKRFGLEFTLRPRGRPRKHMGDAEEHESKVKAKGRRREK